MTVAAALLAVPVGSAGEESQQDEEQIRLVRRAQDGDADAFGVLVDRHGAAARRTALVALGNHAEAEEAVQDACLLAWTRIGSLADPRAFRSWLLQITWRKALDRRRSLVRWMRRTVAASREDPSAGDPWDLVATDAETQEDALLARERDLAIARVIRTLPPKLRDPFLLAATGEHRYDDIAAMLRVPLGTVKWRMSEARRVIKIKLQHMGIGGEQQ